MDPLNPSLVRIRRSASPTGRAAAVARLRHVAGIAAAAALSVGRREEAGRARLTAGGTGRGGDEANRTNVALLYGSQQERIATNWDIPPA